MIWVFDVISNHFSTGHTHCPTQSHIHMLYFRLSLPCVPKFSEGVIFECFHVEQHTQWH